MAKLLYIEASPRKERSHSIAVANAFLDAYAAAHPGDTIDRLDLWAETLPAFDGAMLDAKYAILHGEQPGTAEQAAWGEVERVVARFTSADKYLISMPMWNFGLPYVMKHYIDIVTQPGLSWTVSPEGEYQGLVEGSAVVIYSSAGDYQEGSGREAFDMQKPYVENWLAFLGVTDVRRIVIAGSLGDPAVFRQAEAAALEEASKLAAGF